MHLWSGQDSDEDEEDGFERDPTRIDETIKQLWDLWRAGRSDGPDDIKERECRRRRLGRAVRALAARAGWRDIALRFGHFDGEAARREWGWAVRERYGTSHLRPDGGPLDVHAYTVLVWAEDARPENVRTVVAEDEELPGIPAGSVEHGRWWQLTAANRAETVGAPPGRPSARCGLPAQLVSLGSRYPGTSGRGRGARCRREARVGTF